MLIKFYFGIICSIIVICVENVISHPNVIIILADDLGWNDVSFHGSNQILTPNIDALAYKGVILNRHYVPALCTPSRASLLTGKNQINIGMQHHVIMSDEPWGLGLDEKLMPQYFKDAGYKTHLVGKWHLGFFQRQYTPTCRGFDTHYGYYNGFIGYWDHTLQMTENSTKGFDMRRNLKADYSSQGKYATDLFNQESIDIIKTHNTSKPLFLMISHLAPHSGNDDAPLEAPIEEIEKITHIKNPKRRTLAAMIHKLDEGIGQVIEALAKKDMLNNSIVLFYSDNGAPTVGTYSNAGSNYPFRGQKYTSWEGGVRGVATIWSPLIKHSERVSGQLFHVSDWLPSLAGLAGIQIMRHSKIDGIDQWNNIAYSETKSSRKVILNNIDDIMGYSSYMDDGWKIINGSTHDGQYDRYLGLLNNDEVVSEDEYFKTLLSSKVAKILNLDNIDDVKRLRKEATVQCSESIPKMCNLTEGPCLFNIYRDPCEYNNLADEYPETLKNLKISLNKYRLTSKKPRRKPGDSRSDPIHFNKTWTWWIEDDNCKFDFKVSIEVMGTILMIILSLGVGSIILCNFYNSRNGNLRHYY